MAAQVPPGLHFCTFDEEGKYESEVTLRFDDGDELYVATDFLTMTSPVFERMLEDDFRESGTGVIEMVEKDKADVLEMLNYFHPAVQRRVTEANVMQLIPLAEEYGMTNLISDCRTELLAVLKKMQDAEKFRTEWTKQCSVGRPHCSLLNTCFEILETASLFSYTDIEHITLDTIAQFPANAYNEENDQTIPRNRKHKREKANKKCLKKYKNMNDKLKIKILQKRLKRCDNDCLVEFC